MGRHRVDTHSTVPASDAVSRRRFGRAALLAAPALVVADQLLTAPDADAASTGSWQVGGNALTSTGSIGTTSVTAFALETGGVERMRIGKTGAVGIGTSAPAAALDVSNAAAQTALAVEQASTGGVDGIQVSSATKAGANAVSAYLTANKPGTNAAGVYGVVQSESDSGATAVWGQHFGNGRGVYGAASGAGVGVSGVTGAYNGLAGEFSNPHTSGGNNPLPGVAVRALAADGTYQQIRDALATIKAVDSPFPASFAAGEFAGALGVIGAATTGAGVVGATTGGSADGVVGYSQYAVGVRGIGDFAGVVGEGDLYGVNGIANGTSAIAGVTGTGQGQDVSGVYASVTASASNTAVYALNDAGPAMQAVGDVHIQGTLSKGGGSFKIDHPLDPAGKYLYHSFVESPDMMNVYNGLVTADAHGTATVQLPDWFDALNRDFRYQLTSIGAPAPELHVSAKIADGRFAIAGGAPHSEVSWQVTGIRQDAWADAHRIPVEQDKSAEDRGRYLYPRLIDRAAKHTVSVDRRMRASARVTR